MNSEQSKGDTRPPERRAHWVAAMLLTGVAMTAIARRAFAMRRIASEFRKPAAFLPVPLTKATLPLLRRATRLASTVRIPAGMRMSERSATMAGTAPDVRVVLFERENRAANSPVIVWAHGGGYVLGVPELDARLFFRILEQLDVLIIGVDYRLAPDHPFPAPLDDCYTALTWARSHADDLGIDTARTAIGGVSAGGGLAAALVQRAADEGIAGILRQILVYPMLSDRTGHEPVAEGCGTFIWTPANNRWAWRSYLGHEPGSAEGRAYAVPARRLDLANLPHAWIGVGTLDLFHDENVLYARRLQASGVDCDLDVIEGGYHSFDSMAFDHDKVRAFHQRMIDTLDMAFG